MRIRNLFTIILATFFALPVEAQQLGPSVPRNKIVNATYDLSTATGIQAITGFGFQPTSCFSLGNGGSSQNVQTTFFGMADSARGNRIAAFGATSAVLTGNGFFYFADAAGTATQTAVINSYDVDGLTLGWTKVGSPTGTMQLRIFCSR